MAENRVISVPRLTTCTMFRCGDLVAADASGSWASQYAPTRAAMITATALADAGRQNTA